MTADAEALNLALEHGTGLLLDPEVRELVDMGQRIGRALSPPWLSHEERERIRSTAFARRARIGAGGIATLLRRHRVALAGGVAFTLAAAGFGFSRAHGRRRHAQAAAAGGALA